MNYRMLLILTVLTLFTVPGAQAADLANNLSNFRNGSGEITNDIFIAQAFTTTATDFIISSVTVAAYKSNPATTGTLNLFFYDATGADGRPGALVQASAIASSDLSELGSTPGDTHTWSLNYELDPSTTYYVVLGAESLVGVEGVDWDFTLDSSGVGFPSFYSGSLNSGATWGAPATPFYMQMQVTTVPEPSTYALGMTGLLALCRFGRRKA